MALDALSILNDPTYTPLAAGSGDPFVGSDTSAPEGFFIIVATTLATRDQEGNRHWLSHPEEYVRGGGRP